ncbi:hypothetical protein EXIGLDRAFT_765045 [Exidia glandulosa HHB12029]|uniref:Aminoglycoside phosphotransferase domain-containing protein n=1 Tax=Exidia glandulosa HHB12029 TaxID=1314781 RepID=A0A165KSL0_EXIGL|nr:hypothetical protein EXIGLDRAFT_765045 [Exidia glandulosa HHB12029]
MSFYASLVSSRHIALLYYRAHMAPPMTLNEDFFRRFKKVELWIELPMSTLILLDDKYVLKQIPPHWDVDTIVDHMRQARSILPVPYVYEFGRLGNCCFIVMDTATTLPLLYGNDRQRSQVIAVIAEIVSRLNSVGLAHNDLHPRNIIVDRYYNVVALLDWDYTAPAEYSQDEYLRRLHPRFDFERDRNPDPEFDLPMYTEHDECWDFLFLRNTLDRADAAALSIREFDNARRGVAKLPPASKTWCFRTHSSVVPPRAQRERLSSYSSAKQVALLVSGCNSDWEAVLAALSGHAKVCLLVTDDSQQADRMRSHGSGTPVRLLDVDPCVRIAPGQLPGLEPEPSCT